MRIQQTTPPAAVETDNFTAVVLLDNGLDMNQKNGPPCFGRQDSELARSLLTGMHQVPIIVPRPSTMAFTVEHSKPPTNEGAHVASLIPFYFGMSISPATGHPDILTLLYEIFRLVAGTECQFLNQLREIVQDQPLDGASQDQMELSLSTLGYLRALLEDHKQRLDRSLAFLKTRSLARSLTHASGTVDMSTQIQSDQATDELGLIISDFQDLRDRTDQLASFCKENVDQINSGAILRESRKAIQLADNQSRLTVLAYLFLPLSLITSAFGMNVEQLGSGNKGVWLPFVVLVPVALISWALFYPDKVHRFLLKWTRLKSPHPRSDNTVEHGQGQ